MNSKKIVPAHPSAQASASETLVSLALALVDQLREELRSEQLVDLQQLQQTLGWPEWMNIETASRYLDMPIERIRKLVARGSIPFCQEGRCCRIFFSRRDLDAWMRTWSNGC